MKKSRVKKYWDKELQEYVTLKVRSPFGFCMLEGCLCPKPEIVGIIFVCLDCKKYRLEDCLSLNNNIKQWFEVEHGKRD